MAVEYKATQDPSLDTFKVEYLLGGSAVLAILFPAEYKVNEVRRSRFACNSGATDAGPTNDLAIGQRASATNFMR